MTRHSLLLCIISLHLQPSSGSAQDAGAIKEAADHLKQGDSKAAQALARFGAAAVPALVDVLKEGDAFARGHAAQALGLIGAPAKDAAEPLAEALGSDDVATASQAGSALGRIGPAAVPALLGVLKSPKSDSAFARAAQALARRHSRQKCGPATYPSLEKDAAARAARSRY